jgi:hypothetical protein
MPSSNVPQFTDEQMKQLENVRLREELEDLAEELYALKTQDCDSDDNSTHILCKVLGDASAACENAAAEENPVENNSYSKCKTLYKAANRILENPKDMKEIDFTDLIPHKNENIVDEYDEGHKEDYVDDDDDNDDDDAPTEYDDDFERVYHITVVKGRTVTDSEHYFRRLTPGLQSTKLQIEGDKATLGPFFSKEEEEKAMSELFDGNTNYNKSSSGLWMVNGRQQDKNLDSDWFLKTKRVSVADKSTVSSLGTAKKGQPVRKQGQPVRKQGGKTRNRRHRRKSAKSSSKRIPRVVTKKHRRNRKTRKGKRKEKK